MKEVPAELIFINEALQAIADQGNTLSARMVEGLAAILDTLTGGGE